MMNEKAALLRRIAENKFALVDIHLFKDTHPQDRALDEPAREAFSTANELTKRYEEQYGPLTFAAGSTEQWLMTPWPWELEMEG